MAVLIIGTVRVFTSFVVKVLIEAVGGVHRDNDEHFLNPNLLEHDLSMEKDIDACCSNKLVTDGFKQWQPGSSKNREQENFEGRLA